MIMNKDKLKKLGKELKKVREESKVSYEKMFKLTCIKVEHLDALENGKIDLLPPKIYVKGIVSKYCSLFNLDKNHLDVYLEEIYCDDFNQVSEIEKDHIETKKKLIDYRKMCKDNKVVLFIFSIFVLCFLSFQLSFLVLPPSLDVNLEKGMVIKESPYLIKGEVDRTKYLYINDKPVKILNKGKFEYVYGLDVGVNNIKIILKSSVNKERVFEYKVIFTP